MRKNIILWHALTVLVTNAKPVLGLRMSLIGGVEPILEASPKSSASTILSPWTMSGAPGGEGATP